MRRTAVESEMFRREISKTTGWFLASLAGASIITAAAIVFRIDWITLPGSAFVAFAFPPDTSGWVLISSQAVSAFVVGLLVNVMFWTCLLFFGILTFSYIRHRRQTRRPPVR